MASVTQEFVGYLFQKASQVTDGIRSKAEACQQDYVPVAIAGAAKNRRHWNPLLQRMPDGKAELLGYDKKTDGKTAALVNGFNAHALELDDGHRYAMIHLGSPIISAIKAASDENEISEDNFLLGIIVGYEAATRTALAVQPSHKNRGYHAAGTCGTIGAAIGVAFALGMNRIQMNRVLTCAAGNAAGLLEMQEQNSELKPYNVGRAAMDGLTAAYMGLTDYETPDDMLGGERGFFRAFSEDFSLEKLVGATDYFEIERIYVKPYVSCRHCHSAIEAAIKLHKGLDIGQIDRVEVKTYKLAMKGHDHTDIQGVASAKLSIPYSVAAGLLYGRADLTVFEPLDEKAVALAKTVAVLEDTELTALCPQRRVAVVTVYLKDGTTQSSRVDFPKGEPENPMTDEEMAEKRDYLLKFAGNQIINNC